MCVGWNSGDWSKNDPRAMTRIASHTSYMGLGIVWVHTRQTVESLLIIQGF